MYFSQNEFQLSRRNRGCHLVTGEVLKSVDDYSHVKVGLMHVFIQHTSASLTINENADPDVQIDMETALNRIVPQNQTFIHTSEGPDDMPAHVKSSMMGSSVTIPITDGQLNLGTWQGIYLCEHRDHGGARKIVVTVQGIVTDQGNG